MKMVEYGNRAVTLAIVMFVLGGLLPASAVTAAPEARELSFNGLGVKLSGTLLLPKGEVGAKGWPVVLIVPDAGTASRDGVVVGKVAHPVYRELAEVLAATGVASFRFDRRCQGKSECRKAAVFDDYIDDLLAAVNFLAKQPGVDASRILLFGHADGGLLATSLLAQHDTAAVGLIVAGMSGRTLRRMIREEFSLRMAEEGKTPAEIESYLARIDTVMRGLASGRTEFPGEKLDPLNPYDAELIRRIGEYSVTVSLLVNDPLMAMAAVKVPVLILQGEKDLQSTTRDSVFLEEALKRIYHPDKTQITFPEMDHLLKVNKGKPSFASYADGSRPVDPQFLAAVTKWVETRYVKASK